jgi:hypothetical protein
MAAVGAVAVPFLFLGGGGDRASEGPRVRGKGTLHMAKLPDLRDMLHGSKSPVPTSKLVSSLQPKAGPSRASQVFFRPPTPAPASNSDNDMDTANIVDPDPTVTTPAHAPSLPQDCSVVMAGVDGDAFMGDFEDTEAFFASSTKEKVLNNLQAATKSTHNLVKTLNFWSINSYHLNVDASDTLITKLLQAIYMVTEISLVQHAMAAGSEAQCIALCALIESLCPLPATPTLWI